MERCSNVQNIVFLCDMEFFDVFDEIKPKTKILKSISLTVVILAIFKAFIAFYCVVSDPEFVVL